VFVRARPETCCQTSWWFSIVEEFDFAYQATSPDLVQDAILAPDPRDQCGEASFQDDEGGFGFLPLADDQVASSHPNKG